MHVFFRSSVFLLSFIPFFFNSFPSYNVVFAIIFQFLYAVSLLYLRLSPFPLFHLSMLLSLVPSSRAYYSFIPLIFPNNFFLPSRPSFCPVYNFLHSSNPSPFPSSSSRPSLGAATDERQGAVSIPTPEEDSEATLAPFL